MDQLLTNGTGDVNSEALTRHLTISLRALNILPWRHAPCSSHQARKAAVTNTVRNSQEKQMTENASQTYQDQ